LEKSLVTALRAAVLPTLALPFALAGFGAAMTGSGVSPQVMTAVLLFVAAAIAIPWSQVLARWREKRRADDDNDDFWRRDPRDDDPRSPAGGSGGRAIDWGAFERDFAAYVDASAADRGGRILVTASGPVRSASRR
jgi:hypothetical protein